MRSKDFLIRLIRNYEYCNLTEKQSLGLINEKLSKSISRSTYYNYKKKLCSDEKFQSLKKSIYKSKILKCFLLYLDDQSEPDGYNVDKVISERFPDREDIFEVTKEQEDKISRIRNRVKSNFCIGDEEGDYSHSNLTRVNQLPKNYTIREEYVRCGKEKTKKCKSSHHGPYYYAYWREKVSEHINSKLRKKYLGTIDPRL
ncbi:MAG: hypothetical protein L0H53_12790 [Candidatus Nitrosocosmicus sp.]|nr:hypothetical protein [Candidatus Nitrosocosmicus sp.]